MPPPNTRHTIDVTRLRDWLAGCALQAIIQTPNLDKEPKQAAHSAYAYADAMLTERE